MKKHTLTLIETSDLNQIKEGLYHIDFNESDGSINSISKREKGLMKKVLSASPKTKPIAPTVSWEHPYLPAPDTLLDAVDEGLLFLVTSGDYVTSLPVTGTTDISEEDFIRLGILYTVPENDASIINFKIQLVKTEENRKLTSLDDITEYVREVYDLPQWFAIDGDCLYSTMRLLDPEGAGIVINGLCPTLIFELKPINLTPEDLSELGGATIMLAFKMRETMLNPEEADEFNASQIAAFLIRLIKAEGEEA